MIDKVLLAKLPKKYQALVTELKKTNSPYPYTINVKEGYSFKGYYKGITIGVKSFTEILKLFRENLEQPIATVAGGKREGAGRKSQGYKMVSIRMTEEEKIAVKEFLKKLRENK